MLCTPCSGQSEAAKRATEAPAAEVVGGKSAPATERALTPAALEQRLRLRLVEASLQRSLDQRFTGRRKSNMPGLAVAPRPAAGSAPMGEGDDSDDEAPSA